jgi:hypothetical protein
VVATECDECVVTGAAWGTGADVEAGTTWVDVGENVVVVAITVDVCAAVALWWCLRLCLLCAVLDVVVVLLVVGAAAAVAEVVDDFEPLEPHPATASATAKIGSNARLIAPRPRSRRPKFSQYTDPRRSRHSSG